MTRTSAKRNLVRSIGLRAEIDEPKQSRRFTTQFKEAWGRLPLTVRRELCSHWRKTVVPRVRVMRDIEEPEGWGCCQFEGRIMTEIRFKTKFVESLSDEALVGLIAHELAHAYEEIVSGPLQFDCLVNQSMVEWGFWPELDALALSGRDDLPKRAASRRKLLTNPWG